MTKDILLRQYLSTRRSVPGALLKEPGPAAIELDEIMTIGMRVPDHGKLEPWRLVVFEGAARQRAGQKLAELVAGRDPGVDEDRLEIERNWFLPAPVTIGVLSAPVAHPKVPESEQVLSAGGVCLNLLHGAAALGFGAHWVTQWFAFDAEAAALMGAGPGEEFVGFVHVGTPERRLEDRPRPVLGQKVSRWAG